MAMKYFDIPPGMRVYTLDICEALKGDRKGQYTIRINDRWRILLRNRRSP